MIDKNLKIKLEEKNITTFIPALNYLIRAGYDDITAFTNCVFHYSMDGIFDGFCRVRYCYNNGRGLFIFDRYPESYTFMNDFIEFCLKQNSDIDELVDNSYEFTFEDVRVSNYMLHLSEKEFGRINSANTHSKFVDELPF